MILKDFINQFVCKNTLIRLWFPTQGGHQMVGEHVDDVDMEWEIVKGHGNPNNFAGYEVIGVTDINVDGSYTEAVNIVIKSKQ